MTHRIGDRLRPAADLVLVHIGIFPAAPNRLSVDREFGFMRNAGNHVTEELDLFAFLDRECHPAFDYRVEFGFVSEIDRRMQQRAA